MQVSVLAFTPQMAAIEEAECWESGGDDGRMDGCMDGGSDGWMVGCYRQQICPQMKRDTNVKRTGTKAELAHLFSLLWPLPLCVSGRTIV